MSNFININVRSFDSPAGFGKKLEITRICNFFNSSEDEVLEMYLSNSGNRIIIEMDQDSGL